MSDIRWRGLSHQEIFDSVWSGPGPLVSDQAQQIWRGAGQRITEINDDLTNRLNRLVATFSGEAASATTRSIIPLSDWQEEARQAANRTANGLQYQAGDVAKVRNDMPPPAPSGWPEYPSWLGDPTGGVDPFFLEDWYAADVNESNAAAQAVLAMETYEMSSALNRDLIQPVATPPAVTNDVSISVARASGNPSAGFAGLAAGAGVGAGFVGGPVGPVPSAEAIPAPPPSAPPTASPAPAAPGVGGGLVPVPPGAVGAPIGAGVGGTRPGVGGLVPGQVPPGVGGGSGIPPRPIPGGFPGLSEPGGPIRPGQFPGGIGAGGIGPGGIGPGGIGSGGSGAGGIGPAGLSPGGTGPGGIGSPGAGAGGLGPGGGVGGLGPGGGAGGGPGGLGPSGGAGGGAGTGAGGLSPSGTGPGGTAAGGRPPGSPGFFPGLGAGAGGGGAREHRRPSYLVDDTDAFGDHRWVTSGVLTPDDRPARRRTADDYY